MRHATDRQAVIRLVGITDPLDVAVIETEWLCRVAPPSASTGGPSPAALASSSPSQPLGRLGVQNLQRYHQNLHAAPAEVQDTVLAFEAIGALVGRGGAFFIKGGEGFGTTGMVPPALRAAVESIIPAADAYLGLVEASAMELTARSSVGMALGEVISETCCAYVQEVAKVEAWCRANPMPLMRVLAEAQSLSYPVVRLHAIVAEMRRRWEGQANGGRLLHFLHMQLTQSSGSEEDKRLIGLVLRRAAIPYLEILKQWMREGVLRDSFGEFFVVENRWAEAADADDPSQAFNNRFIFKKEMVPGFINRDRMAKMAFVAGQYCCLVRECTGALPPIAALTEHEPITWTDAEELQRTVQRYYDSACGAIIALLFDSQHDLLGRLGSIKRYFLHSKGDWLVDFLDSAGAMLNRSPQHVKAHSVKVLLQSSIAKACASDPYHPTIGCSFSGETLADVILRGGEDDEDEDEDPAEAMRRRRARLEGKRCVELLQLKVEYQWPLTLVITPIVEQHFNTIFRLMLWIKAAERGLHEAWWHRGVASPLAFSLKQQMIQFLRQFQFYASHFVLERLWGKLMGKLAQADSVFAISQALEIFFVAVDQELALSSPSRFQSLSRLLELVDQFSQIGYQSDRMTLQQSNTAVQRVGEEFWRGLAALASPRGSDYPHLVPLLTWIDFSRYYEVRNVFRVVHGAAAADSDDAPPAHVSSSVRGSAGLPKASSAAAPPPQQRVSLQAAARDRPPAPRAAEPEEDDNHR